MMQLMTFLPEQPQRYPPRQQTVASRIMNWIEAHYASKFSLDQLACDLGLSRSYTSRVFVSRPAAISMNICSPGE